jgi:hypothetical protein
MLYKIIVIRLGRLRTYGLAGKSDATFHIASPVVL